MRFYSHHCSLDDAYQKTFHDLKPSNSSQSEKRGKKAQRPPTRMVLWVSWRDQVRTLPEGGKRKGEMVKVSIHPGCAQP